MKLKNIMCFLGINFCGFFWILFRKIVLMIIYIVCNYVDSVKININGIN